MGRVSKNKMKVVIGETAINAYNESIAAEVKKHRILERIQKMVTVVGQQIKRKIKLLI